MELGGVARPGRGCDVRSHPVLVTAGKDLLDGWMISPLKGQQYLLQQFSGEPRVVGWVFHWRVQIIFAPSLPLTKTRWNPRTRMQTRTRKRTPKQLLQLL